MSDRTLIAGDSTVGFEILEDLPEVQTVVVPYGGGGLSCGIAAALRGRNSTVPVFGVEVDTAAPLATSLTEGKAVSIERTPSFVDGIRGSSVLPDMWPMAPDLLAGSLVTSIDRVCDAIRALTFQAHVIAEGAGASRVAAAMEHVPEDHRIVAVVSGGNIDVDVLRQILEWKAPS